MLLEASKTTIMNIGLGTAAIGRPHYINLREEENSYTSLDDFKKQGIDMLDQAYHAGVRYFDTAPGYGVAEQLLIDWLADKQYTDVEVATKWGYTYVANFQKDAEVHEIKEHSLAKLNEQWLQSKKLLPYLTSYQIHSATFDTKVLENQAVLHRLDELKQEFGLKIGLTTTGTNQYEVLNRSLDVHVNGSMLFDLFQVTYNVFDQILRDSIRQLAAENKRVVIKEALANGRVFENPTYPHYAAAYAELKRLAGKYGVGLDAIALRFCMDSVQPFMVLSGASRLGQLSENLASTSFSLANDELALLYEYAVAPMDYWQERKSLVWN